MATPQANNEKMNCLSDSPKNMDSVYSRISLLIFISKMFTSKNIRTFVFLCQNAILKEKCKKGDSHMSIITIISLSITFGMMLLSILFKLAGKIRLTLPLLYLLLTATVLNKWASSHEVLAFIILFILVGLSVFRWIRSICNNQNEKKYYKAVTEDLLWQTERVKQLGIPLDSVHFDSQGNLRYNINNELVI